MNSNIQTSKRFFRNLNLTTAIDQPLKETIAQLQTSSLLKKLKDPTISLRRIPLTKCMPFSLTPNGKQVRGFSPRMKLSLTNLKDLSPLKKCTRTQRLFDLGHRPTSRKRKSTQMFSRAS